MYQHYYIMQCLTNCIVFHTNLSKLEQWKCLVNAFTKQQSTYKNVYSTCGGHTHVAVRLHLNCLCLHLPDFLQDDKCTSSTGNELSPYGDTLSPRGDAEGI